MDVLMLDESNPRALRFQLEHLADLYGKLPRFDPEELKAMNGALDTLHQIDLQGMTYPAEGGASSRDAGLQSLDKYLGELETLLLNFSNNLSVRYFSHARTLPITMGQ